MLGWQVSPRHTVYPVLEIKPMASHRLGKHPLNEPHPQACHETLTRPASLEDRGGYAIFIPSLPAHRGRLRSTSRVSTRVSREAQHQLRTRCKEASCPQTQGENNSGSREQTPSLIRHLTHTPETMLLTEGRDHYRAELLGKSGPPAGWPRKDF